MAQGKAGSAQGQFRPERWVTCFDPLGEKCCPKGWIFENPEIENGTETDQSRKNWHRDHLKTVPGGAFQKNKNMKHL